jgi:hypothetical protein
MRTIVRRSMFDTLLLKPVSLDDLVRMLDARAA